MFDFGSLPPEINSARMYTGPGAGSLLAAAAAWQQLAADLYDAAACYGSVVSGLTSGGWAGPSATAMAAAAMPYVTWLSATAAAAEQAGAQAGAAAAAHAAAFAATVPPPLIEANRSLLATLVATNLLGQNTPAIAGTEALYAEMWAQDAAAMYGYAGASAAATRLTQFTPAPQTTAQTAAQAAGASAVPVNEALMSTAPQLISATPPALQSLAAPAAATGETTAGSSLASMSSLSSLSMPLRMAMMPMSMLMRMLMGGANGAKGAAGLAGTTAAAPTAAAGTAATSVTLAGFSSGGSAATAGLGRAAAIGALSVPPAWTGLGVASTPVGAALPATTTVGAAAPAAGVAHPVVPPMMPVAGVAGRGGFGGPAAQYDFRPTVIPRSPAAG